MGVPDSHVVNVQPGQLDNTVGLWFSCTLVSTFFTFWPPAPPYLDFDQCRRIDFISWNQDLRDTKLKQRNMPALIESKVKFEERCTRFYFSFHRQKDFFPASRINPPLRPLIYRSSSPSTTFFPPMMSYGKHSAQSWLSSTSSMVISLTAPNWSLLCSASFDSSSLTLSLSFKYCPQSLRLHLPLWNSCRTPSHPWIWHVVECIRPPFLSECFSARPRLPWVIQISVGWWVLPLFTSSSYDRSQSTPSSTNASLKSFNWSVAWILKFLSRCKLI